MEGIALEATESFLAAHASLVPPLSFELVAGGRSNLTYLVTDSRGREVVLRRPPTGHVLPTAHDMRREYRVISALEATPVPVPLAIALCEDETVTGAPFYLMEYVRGLVVRDRDSAARLDEHERTRASESVATVLAALHSVEPDAVGLGDLGRRESYLSRQLRRWYAQFDKTQVPGEPRANAVDEVFAELEAAAPRQRETTIVHGDYRLDNTVLDANGDILAVLDWEICTLGDPLADVGLLMVYWSEPTDEMSVLGDTAATAMPGFWTRAELCERYGELSGRDLAGLAYYVAFGYWKLACILQGVYFRYRSGASAGDRSRIELFGPHVRHLADAARASLEGGVR